MVRSLLYTSVVLPIVGLKFSILMEGYIEKSKLVSLRGTLVPATTINKAIGSIPILGDILVGKIIPKEIKPTHSRLWCHQNEKSSEQFTGLK